MREHVADSLVALDLAPVRRATTIADLGSGPGFPGLPLAIALPGAAVALVESSSRKCSFLRTASAVAETANVTVVPARAEEWDAGLGRCDLIVVRALAPLAVVVEYAAPLLCLGGSLVAWRGRRDPDDESAGVRAAQELGLELVGVEPVVPFAGALHRHLHALVKVGATPGRFPRRPGMARKRPLGGPVEGPLGGRLGTGAEGAPSDREAR
jgi:16S rRNA (guanine527-N7)-methyltransferase